MTLDNRVTGSRAARTARSPTATLPVVHGNLRKLARKNTDFRREIATTEHAQVTLMSIERGDEIGQEIHDVDQFLVLVQGHGELWLEGSSYPVPKGSLVTIAAGTRHNLINTGSKALRLFSIYAPPHHARGTVHRTRADAIAAEERESQLRGSPQSRRPGARIRGDHKAPQRNQKA